MAIIRVQHANNGGDNSTPTVSLLSTTSGNLLVVAMAWDGAVSITNVTDDAGNMYQQTVGGFGNVFGGFGNPNNLAIWYSNNILPGATLLTVTFSGGTSQISISVFEYSGAAISSVEDTSGFLSMPSGGVVDSPTLTLTNVADVMVTIYFSNNDGITIVSPGTAIIVDNFFSTWAIAEDFPNTTGSYNESTDGSVLQPWCSASAAFLPGAPTLTLNLFDSSSSSDSLSDSFSIPLSDSMGSSDLFLQSFLVQSDFTVPVSIPIVENLTTELLPSNVKAYFNIVE